MGATSAGGEDATGSPLTGSTSLSAVLLDAPAGLLARRAEEGSHVVLRWLPPPGAPMTTHIRYEVDVSAGNRAGGTQRVRTAPPNLPESWPKVPLLQVPLPVPNIPLLFLNCFLA